MLENFASVDFLWVFSFYIYGIRLIGFGIKSRGCSSWGDDYLFREFCEFFVLFGLLNPTLFGLDFGFGFSLLEKTGFELEEDSGI